MLSIMDAQYPQFFTGLSTPQLLTKIPKNLLQPPEGSISSFIVSLSYFERVLFKQYKMRLLFEQENGVTLSPCPAYTSYKNA